MSPGDPIAVGEQDVFALTGKGSAELKAAGTSLSVAELELLVLLDGNATVARVAQSARKSLPGDVIEILRSMVRNDLIASANQMSAGRLEFGGVFTSTASKRDEVQGVSSLHKQRYYVQIARRPAAGRELKAGQHPTVLVVDDDPDLIKLLRTYLMLEGFVAQTAANREEIVAAFRQTPPPDLVLLDVQMPDADGFDVLVKLRQHPVLKAVPVIMLTGEATREAVLRGLRADVEGYVTKPFEPDMLMTAVKAVLGLPDDAGSKSPWTENYGA
jgi:CheY-like chemotaxis protein